MVAFNTVNGEVAIIGGKRTPFARAGTELRQVPASDLARRAFQETLFHCNCRFDRLDEVILGNVVMPADSANLARVSALWAQIPQRVPGLTVQRNCASGMESVAQAAMHIRGGLEKIVLAGGAESMSTVPLLFPQESTIPLANLGRARTLLRKAAAAAALRPRHFHPVVGLELGLSDATCGMIMGQTAEVLAHQFGIKRQQQDEFALQSHQKAIAAADAGKFSDEIVPMYVAADSDGGKFTALGADNGPRKQQSMEALAKLRPLFDKRDGSVTAGNSCQITDGAAALLVADSSAAKAMDMNVLGYVRSYAYAALDPARMGLGPVFAINALLKQTGMSLSDIDLFEINEAFAAQVLACLKAMNSVEFCREHLDRDSAIGEIDPAKLNVNGGAIALGHPVGATGARLVLTLLLEMQRRNVQFGIASLCVGGGQGAAILLERKA
jgi:acetyl-CoA C-acetyltransferase/acetyl-CoA acyltransferase